MIDKSEMDFTVGNLKSTIDEADMTIRELLEEMSYVPTNLIKIYKYIKKLETEIDIIQSIANSQEFMLMENE